MLETKVLIVGGGPAGSTLAWSLKRAGIASVILDKADFPRDKVCAGWVTPAVMQELEIDIDRYAHEHVLQPITAFRTGLIGQNPVQSEFLDDPVSYGIRRVEFDNFLLRRCGAELRLGEGVKSIRSEGNHWFVNDSIRASLLVGAGGHFCPVARFINDNKSPETAVIAQETEFHLSPEQRRRCPVLATTPELFFTPDLKGYGWVFRKGEYLNIGLGREDKHKLSGHVERFCSGLTESGRIPADLPARFRGHAYLLYSHADRKLIDERIMLIGDAAGLAYPQSGEGIRPAVESALLAAEVIRHCGDDCSVDGLYPYLEEMEARFGKRQPGGGLVGLLPMRFKQILASQLMKNQWLVKNLVVNRWFLHRQDQTLKLRGPQPNHELQNPV
jgi:flavin-dependent dehydrogenase